MTDKPFHPDYELDDLLEVREPGQFRAVGDPVRQRVIGILSERAATTSQLAEALGETRGNVGYHLKILAEARLVKVVRTRQVRAITEKYYGRTARLFNFVDAEAPEPLEPFLFFRQAMSEHVAPPTGEEQPSTVSTLRHARIPAARAREFCERVLELADEFSELERVPGERSYGFVAGVYLADLPELPGEDG